jgi:hypothetical protein
LIGVAISRNNRGVMEEEKAYLIYIGQGKGLLPGVPARNLTRAEAEKNGGETFLIQTKLYAYAKQNEVVIKKKNKRSVKHG